MGVDCFCWCIEKNLYYYLLCIEFVEVDVLDWGFSIVEYGFVCVCVEFYVSVG